MVLASGIELRADEIADVCKRYGVRELAVFGSAVSGGMRPDSDIDFLVEFLPETHVGLVKFARLTSELERLVGRAVDLVTKRGLKPWVRPHVLQQAQLIYAE